MMKLVSTAHFIVIGDKQLPIVIRKHRTSRRLVVRYQPLRECVSLTLPRYVTIKQGLDFIQEKREWITRQVQQFSHAKNFSDGVMIPVLGRDMRLVHVGGRGLASEAEGELFVHGEASFMARRVRDYLHKRLKTEINSLAERYASRLGVNVGRITIRDTSSHWGSCSAGGNLSFSWRLVFAPYAVLDYVVAHEVAHIREHNHSAKFWALVQQVFPGYEAQRDWLKLYGETLYKFG